MFDTGSKEEDFRPRGGVLEVVRCSAVPEVQSRHVMT